MQTVKTSDVARLMELFQVRIAIPLIYNYRPVNCVRQSSLLKYWEFNPTLPDSRSDTDSKNGKRTRREATTDTQDSSRTNVERVSQDTPHKSRWGFKSWGKRKRAQVSETAARHSQGSKNEPSPNEKGKEKEKDKVIKKMPVCPAYL